MAFDATISSYDQTKGASTACRNRRECHLGTVGYSAPGIEVNGRPSGRIIALHRDAIRCDVELLNGLPGAGLHRTELDTPASAPISALLDQ